MKKLAIFVLLITSTVFSAPMPPYKPLKAEEFIGMWEVDWINDGTRKIIFCKNNQFFMYKDPSFLKTGYWNVKDDIITLEYTAPSADSYDAVVYNYKFELYYNRYTRKAKVDPKIETAIFRLMKRLDE